MMSKLIKRIVLICIILGTANTIYCQTEWQSYYSETTLPEKAKLKTVKYKSYNYAVFGYIFENQFVNGQELNLYSTNTETNVIPIYVIPVPISNTKLTNLIISGTYFVIDGIAYLKSTVKQEGNSHSGEISINGIFRISNTFDDSGLTIRPREAKDLNIKTEDIITCSGFYYYNKYPITLSKQSNKDDYDYRIEFDDKILDVDISTDYLKGNFFPNVNSLFQQRSISLNFDNYIKNSKNVKLTYNNGDVFIGEVETNNSYNYNPIKGKYTFSNGEIFIGNINQNSQIWTDGDWKFNDGSTENGDWLKKYNVTSNDLSGAETMTEKRSLAISLYEQKQKEERKREEEMNWRSVPVNNEFGNLQKCYVKSPEYRTKEGNDPYSILTSDNVELIVYPPSYGKNAIPIIRFVIQSNLISTAQDCNIAIQTPDGNIIRFNNVELFNVNIGYSASAQIEGNDAIKILNTIKNCNEFKLSIQSAVIGAFGVQKWDGLWTIDTKGFIKAYKVASDCCIMH